MALNVEKNDGFMVATCWERVTMQDVCELWRAAASSAVETILVDLRLATRMPFYKEMQVATAAAKPPSSVRAAFVCSSSLISGSVRLLTSLSEISDYEVFASTDDARNWLCGRRRS